MTSATEQRLVRTPDRDITASNHSELPETSAMAVLRLGRIIRALENGQLSDVGSEDELEWLSQVQSQVEALSTQLAPKPGRAGYGFASPLDYYVVSRAAESLISGHDGVTDVGAVVKESLGSVREHIRARRVEDLNRVLKFLRQLRDLSFLREDAMLRSDSSGFAMY